MKELHEAIWSVSGGEGKQLTILGGTHGNERTGVEAVLKLREMIESGILEIINGTCNLVLANPLAIQFNQKRSGPFSPDLNRSYPTDLLNNPPDGTYENARARTIAPFLIASDVVLDLHSTTNPSEPFICSLHSPRHEEIYRWFTCDKVLADPNFVTGGKSITTDEYTEAHGGIGICYETGQATDTSRVDEVIKDILNLMSDLKLIAHEKTPSSTEKKEIFELVDSIIVTSEGFRFAEGWGNQSWEQFHAGDVIGYHGEKPMQMNYEGMTVFPQPTTNSREGSRVASLARKL